MAPIDVFEASVVRINGFGNSGEARCVIFAFAKCHLTSVDHLIFSTLLFYFPFRILLNKEVSAAYLGIKALPCFDNPTNDRISLTVRGLLKFTIASIIFGPGFTVLWLTI